MDWIDLSLGGDRLQAVVNAAMKPQTPQSAGNLTRVGILSFCRVILLRGLCKVCGITVLQVPFVICVMSPYKLVDCVWNVMAHAQKPDFVFRRNGRVHLNRRGRQFSRLLAAEVCVSAVVMLNTPCSEVVWRVLATHSIRQFPLHFPSRALRQPSHFNWSLTTFRRTFGFSL